VAFLADVHSWLWLFGGRVFSGAGGSGTFERLQIYRYRASYSLAEQFAVWLSHDGHSISSLLEEDVDAMGVRGEETVAIMK